MDFPVVTERMALINVHLQNCFVKSPDQEKLVDRISQFAALCRAAKMLVVHTRSIWRADGANAGILGEIYPSGKEIFRSDAPTAALHPRLAVDAQDIVVDAPSYGAFFGTDLELILRTKGIDSIVIGGIATNIACDTTAREAAARNFHVFFLGDGTMTNGSGDISGPDMQRATLATLGALFAQVVTMDEMSEKIRRAAPAVAN